MIHKLQTCFHMLPPFSLLEFLLFPCTLFLFIWTSMGLFIGKVTISFFIISWSTILPFGLALWFLVLNYFLLKCVLLFFLAQPQMVQVCEGVLLLPFGRFSNLRMMSLPFTLQPAWQPPSLRRQSIRSKLDIASCATSDQSPHLPDLRREEEAST